MHRTVFFLRLLRLGRFPWFASTWLCMGLLGSALALDARFSLDVGLRFDALFRCAHVVLVL